MGIIESYDGIYSALHKKPDGGRRVFSLRRDRDLHLPIIDHSLTSFVIIITTPLVSL